MPCSTEPPLEIPASCTDRSMQRPNTAVTPWRALVHRFLIAWLERELRVSDLDRALLERRAEGGAEAEEEKV